MAEPTLADACAAIATFASEHESFVAKTKLLKLLYLIDIEYYRIHQRTFTGFSWKFFHLGPWANEFDPMLDGLLASGVLAHRYGRHDTPWLEPVQRLESHSVFPNIKDDLAFNSVLRRWAGEPLNVILDHVYFGTEPMAHAFRNEPLDFALVSSELPKKYERPSSGVSPQEIKKLRAHFYEHRAARAKSNRVITPPNYDDVFMELISRQEKDDTY